MTRDELPVEYQLLKDLAALDLRVLDTKIETFMDSPVTSTTSRSERDFEFGKEERTPNATVIKTSLLQVLQPSIGATTNRMNDHV